MDSTSGTSARSILVFGEALRLRPAVRVAACSGAEVVIEADPGRIVAAARELEPSVVLFDHDHAGPAALELARALHQQSPSTAIVLLAHPSPPADIGVLLHERWFRHLLALTSPWFMEELTATLARLEGASPFGLKPCLPWGTHVHSIEITASDDKDDVFERIEHFMGGLGIRSRLVRRLCDVADEMLMNAVYDAPRDENGAHPFAELTRDTRVELAPAQRPTFSFASDGRTLALGIRDPFGGLTPATLKRYIAKGLRRGADQIDRKKGGAGLGLFILFDSLNSMWLGLTPGERTEMVGLLNIRGSYRDLLNTPKSFNIFVQGDS